MVKRKHEKSWMEIDGVVAVGVGLIDEKTGIIVSVEKEPATMRKLFPSSIEGIPIAIRQTGQIEAQ